MAEEPGDERPVETGTDRPDDPAPEVQSLLADLDAQGAMPAAALSVAGAREALVDLFADQSGPAVGDVLSYGIPGPDGGDLRVRVYRPEEPRGTPALAFFHGGGWVRGGLDTHDGLCRWLCADADCVVASVDYRRAPEHPFPAAFRDAYAATQWLAERGGDLGADADRLVVAGDSAGGNLAAAVALAARDRGDPAVARQVLLYPALEPDFETDSYRESATGYLLTRESMRWYWDHYLARDLDARHPYAAPLRARDLSGVAPAQVVTCGFDPLRDEGRAYADRLREAGVAVEYRDYPAAIHAVLSFPTLDLARTARAEVAADLRDALA